MLAAQGYTNVREYAAGKKEWRESGLPLERSDGQASGAAGAAATAGTGTGGTEAA